MWPQLLPTMLQTSRRLGSLSKQTHCTPTSSRSGLILCRVQFTNRFNRFSHLLIATLSYRCYMHGFHLVIGSILAFPWAKAIVGNAQRVVTYFKASHMGVHKLYEESRRQGIKTGLVTSNTTRFTSVADMNQSLLLLKLCLQSISNSALVKVQRVLKIIQSDRFWTNLKTISAMLQPFTLVVMAICNPRSQLP
jgi:hypothetical protein